MNYEETLKTVENFMKESGIRDFCENVCHGTCCAGCYETNPNACIVFNERKLGCSIFTCWSLRKLLPEEIRKTFEKVVWHITDLLHSSAVGNIYFNRYSEEFKNALTFDDAIVKQLTKINCEQVQKTIKEITKKISEEISPRDPNFNYLMNLKSKAEFENKTRFLPKEERSGKVSYI